MIPLRISALLVTGGLVLVGCGSGDVEPVASASPTTVAAPAAPSPAAATVAPATPEATSDANGLDGTAVPEGVPPTAQATPPTPGWPNRYCVDAFQVETTLNLRAGPSLDAAIVASIPRSSCDLVIDPAHRQENGYEPVRYTIESGAQLGWVSTEFIELQDPPQSLEAAALLFVEAWQRGLDTGPYSYDVGTLPRPIDQGYPVLVEGTYDGWIGGPDQVGCAFVGDISITCAVGLVDDNGTRVADLLVGGTQRGANGYEDSFWPPDFPDGPTITSLRAVADYR